MLEGATWRANPDWAAKLGYSRAELAVANRAAIDLMVGLRDAHESKRTPIVISANIGPRGDGYRIENAMTATEAEDYHGWQVSIFRDTEADLVSAFTINYVEEGIGVARACRKAGIPSVISFTVETDGRLASGQTINNLWNGINSGTSGNVSVKNASYNGSLGGGASTSFGFVANGNSSSTPSVSCSSP